ncbi:MAG: hypothetical protein WCX31_06145 [Salinivirgaceae bacterium]|jgi:hypothetical protein
MKQLFILLIFFGTGFPLIAQEEFNPYIRPKDIGIALFDDFKNSAFDCYDASVLLKKKVLKTKIITPEEQEEIKKIQLTIDTLYHSSKSLKIKAPNLSHDSKAIAANQLIQKTIAALDKATLNFRITYSVLEDLEEVEE